MLIFKCIQPHSFYKDRSSPHCRVSTTGESAEELALSSGIPRHPAHSLLTFMKSGKWYWSITARTSRLRDSLYPQAVRCKNNSHLLPLPPPYCPYTHWINTAACTSQDNTSPHANITKTPFTALPFPLITPETCFFFPPIFIMYCYFIPVLCNTLHNIAQISYASLQRLIVVSCKKYEHDR